MSELRKLNDLKADAHRCADKGLDPHIEQMKYEPMHRVIWMTHYAYRMEENERRVAA
jgi:hypothetical protein